MADNHRLRELITLLKAEKIIRNQEHFAEILATNRNLISRYATGREEFSERFADKVCRVFTEVNKEWLLHGVGEKLLYPLQGKNKATIADKPEWCKRCKELTEKLQSASDDLIVCLKEKEMLRKKNETLTDAINRIYLENPHLPRPQVGGKSKAG